MVDSVYNQQQIYCFKSKSQYIHEADDSLKVSWLQSEVDL